MLDLMAFNFASILCVSACKNGRQLIDPSSSAFFVLHAGDPSLGGQLTISSTASSNIDDDPVEKNDESVMQSIGRWGARWYRSVAGTRLP